MAEIYYLKGDEATALIYLQQAFAKKALGWVYYMEVKRTRSTYRASLQNNKSSHD